MEIMLLLDYYMEGSDLLMDSWKRRFFTKLAYLTLATTLLIPLFSNVSANAEGSDILYQETFTDVVEGVEYNTTSVEDENYIITTITNNEGFQKFTTNKFTGEITITSDYLTSEDLAVAETSVNDIANQLDAQIKDEPYWHPTPDTISSGEIGTNSVVGSYVWSSWQSVTVTYASKATYTIIVAAILSRIPYIGWVAGATASILIAHNLPIGYLKYRMGTARDTHPDYVWTKKTVNVYKDSKRTYLLDSNTSNPYKVRVY
jgi:hypothetical protein